MGRVTRVLLVLGVLLVGCLGVVGWAGVSAAETSAAQPTTSSGGEVHVVTVGSVWAKTVYFKTDYAWCSGALVGPRTVLTAAHCLEGVSKVRAWVGHYFTGTGHPEWLYACVGTRAWAATAHPGAVDDADWGIFDLGRCRSRSGTVADRPVGDLVGYHGVQVYDTRDTRRGLLYAGYPGGTGHLRTVAGVPHRWPFLEVALAYPTQAFGLARMGFTVTAGGSGGPLLAAAGDGSYRVVGLDKGLYRGQAHFVEVTPRIEATVTAARAGRYPPGATALR